MHAAMDRMPSVRRFLQPACVDPGDGSGHHTKIKMVGHGHRILGLHVGAADIRFSSLKNTSIFQRAP